MEKTLGFRNMQEKFVLNVKLMNIVYGCKVLMDTVVAVCDPKHNRLSGPAEHFQI